MWILAQDLVFESAPGRPRFDPELGSGRPEEIVAALGEAAGSAATDVQIVAMTRERLILADDGPVSRRR